MNYELVPDLARTSSIFAYNTTLVILYELVIYIYVCVCIRESILYKMSLYYYHSMDIIQLQYVQSTIRNRNKVIIRGGVPCNDSAFLDDVDDLRLLPFHPFSRDHIIKTRYQHPQMTS